MRSLLEEGGVEALERFVREWRSNFLETMEPRYLPAHWDVNSRVVNSSAGPASNHSDPLLPAGEVSESVR